MNLLIAFEDGVKLCRSISLGSSNIMIIDHDGDSLLIAADAKPSPSVRTASGFVRA